MIQKCPRPDCPSLQFRKYGTFFLFRRTWCTTKKKECLEQHLAVYLDFHNRVLISRGSKPQSNPEGIQ